MMYNVSPFERVLGEAGGSLMLAVVNGRIVYPEHDRRPAALKELVAFCLHEASRRPSVAAVIARSNEVLQTLQHRAALSLPS